MVKKTEPLWIGLYQVYDVDQRNRIILRDIKTDKILKRKFSYLHIKPYNEAKDITNNYTGLFFS